MKTHEVKNEEPSPSEPADGLTVKTDASPLQEPPATAEEQRDIPQEPVQQEAAQKRYKCGVCVKTYMYLHSLKKHMLTHVQVSY
jgi:hypothetical protein